MDTTPGRPVRRADFGTTPVAVTEVPLDGITLESLERREIDAPHSAQKRGKGGYDRNSRRRIDEKLYYRKRHRLMYAVPSAVFVVAAAVMLWNPFTNSPEVLSAQQASAASDTVQQSVTPLAWSSDETPAANYIETYKTAANRPRVLTIDSLGVRARVLEVGVDGRHHPQLPRNSYDTGWYNVSVLPGQSGAVVLSGACNGSVGEGAFRRLNELAAGAQLTIEKGDGTTVAYEVQSVATVAVDTLDMTSVLLPAHGFSRGLNLVGCSGKYDVKTNDFASRVVVYATEE